MSSALLQRLAAVLTPVGGVVEEADDALTVAVAGSVASLRVVALAEGLEMVSLTQPLAWDLPLTAKTRERVAAHASATLLGTVALVEKPVSVPTNGASAEAATRKSSAKKVADVMLRYNFPCAGLTDDALRTLILLVLAGGADVRAALLAN
ncbi:hypothetical protein [Mycolicibacterium confluentis]|uniref:Uncharacterized protein n=1 Tax=Mycolicibacterium confluentis TaxID=28047 RepID=A0A7I7XUT6_9MYCO|nr:hypothetical protein [Mycolicibacterium confluentis]MCV7322210.1 hypothetical protein [Mycolicibacterium confluentis]ORV31474.1 hypothetical protein AWB99_11775 [Mycolicibacterium confluentis]BBZ32894.1 hypothetical protein MCNF_14990 [Mycolicibacterium confluentis]